MTPLHPIVEALLSRLDENLREAFEERAGIMQFEAGHPRGLAEALAMLEVLRSHPLAVSGIVTLDVRVSGEQMTVITVDEAKTLDLIATKNGQVNQKVDLTEAIRRTAAVAVLKSLC